jgi:hypothetical protein
MSSSDKFHDYYADLNPQLPRNMVFDMDMDGPEAYNGTNYAESATINPDCEIDLVRLPD